MNEIRLSCWYAEGDKVRLVYEDNTELYVTKENFDRAFGCIISLSKEDVIRDFAVNN